MDNLNVNIIQDANAAPEALQVIIDRPSTEVVFQGSLTQLKDKIASYDEIRARFDQEQAFYQGVYDKAVGTFTAQAIDLPTEIIDAASPVVVDPAPAVGEVTP